MSIVLQLKSAAISLKGTFFRTALIADMTAIETTVNANEVQLNALQASAGVSAWSSGGTYAVGAVVYSPTNFLNYRNKTGAVGTDPAGDITNWESMAQTAVETHGATSKATPVDADEIPLADSATGFSLKKLTWANLKDKLFSGGTFTGLLTLASGVNIASAATVNLTAATGNSVTITGTTATSAFTMNDGQHMTLVAAAAWPLTYHATNCKIVGGANYTCKADQKVELFKTGGIVYVFPYGVIPEAATSLEAVQLGQLTNGSALSGQIKFPATQNPSADANTLDDYEEGTFTATLTGCTTSPTIDFKYTKVGRVVTVTPLTASVNGVSNSTSKTLTGIPVAISPSVSYYDHSISSDNGGSATMSACLVGSGGTWSLQPNTNSANWTASGGCAWYPKSYSWSI